MKTKKNKKEKLLLVKLGCHFKCLVGKAFVLNMPGACPQEFIVPSWKGKEELLS
jgi:hypothetical protein